MKSGMKRMLSSLLITLMATTTVFNSTVKVQAIDDNSAIKNNKNSSENFSDYVNMYIGTKYDPSVHHKGNSEYGGTMLMVSSPFGMTNFAPQTRENRIGSMSNRSEDTSIGGFIATHQPAVWMGDYGYVTMMPQIGDVKTKFDDRKLSFDRENEKTTPYYYSVDLNTKNNKVISAEMTATERCAIYNFQFPEDETSSILVEASRSEDIGNLVIDVENQQIKGYNTDIMSSHLNNNPPKDFKGYFVIEFDKPFSAVGTSNNYNISKDTSEVTSKGAGGYVTFDNPNNEEVRVKIGTSFISLEQAQKNLDKEIPTWDFDKVKNDLKNVWNEKLGTIEIEGASDDERTIFYTALYHSLLYPRIFHEDGKYYSPFDDQIHEGVAYTDYSLWDTFRAQNSLLTLVAPEHIDGMVQSLLQNYQEGGYMPKWSNPYYTNIMIGTHADSVVAEAIAKGFNGFDHDLAYAAVLKDALVPPENDLSTKWFDRQTGVGYEARGGLSYYKALGYIPNDKTAEAGSRTLEGAYDDWCVAQVAKAVGNEEDYKFFINRSQNYKNVYNQEEQKMMSKNVDGTWVNGSWTEGKADNYNWCVLQDFGGLVNLMGEDVYNTNLDKYFMEGKNEHDNEPSHHYGYLYNYSGRPWKTQEIVRKILRDNYRADELGLMGNDDCGQMSSWYLFSAMGFYPVTPASGDYMIGSPIFDKVTIHLQDGKDFVIEAKNNPDDNVYIESATLNGNILNKPVLSHKDIVNGGNITFNMSPTKTYWASDYRIEALPTYENTKNPEDDYIPFIGDSTAKVTDMSENIALKAKADATSHTVVSDGGTADTLNDGSIDRGWCSENNPEYPQYLTLTWDELQKFNQLKIYSNYARKQGPTNIDIEILKEKNGEWESVLTNYDLEWTSSDETPEEKQISLTEGYTAYGIRIKINEAKTEWGKIAVRELEVYNSKGANIVDLSDPQDIYILTNPLLNVLEDVKYKDQVLRAGRDYVIDGDIVILKADFLKTLTIDESVEIELVYNIGKSPIVKLEVKDLSSAYLVKRNIALKAKADATSHTVVSDGGTADTLNDGSLDRGWCSEVNPEYPQYLTFTWNLPQSFNEIKMYSNYAKNQAPNNIDIEVLTERSGEWEVVESDIELDWTSSSEEAEEKIILTKEIQSVYGMRIKINSANTTWSKIAVREIEIMSDKFNVVKGSEEDIDIEFELNGNKLKNVKNGNELLKLNKDYIITNDTKVTIKDTYLKTLSKEVENLEFEFDKGSPEIVTIYTHGFVAVDKSNLKTLINKCEGLDSSEYTYESWNVMNEALKNARKVFDDEEATELEVTKAIKDLEDALNNLVKVEKPSNLRAEEVTSNSLNLSWNEPKNTEGLIGYEIYKDGKLITEVESNKTNYLVEGLKANTIYGFKVVSKYSNNEKSKPVSVNVRTKKN